jgi:hypothetical protein
MIKGMNCGIQFSGSPVLCSPKYKGQTPFRIEKIHTKQKEYFSSIRKSYLGI